MVSFDLDEFASEAVWFAKQLGHEKVFTVEEVRKAVEFISLSEEAQKNIGLWSGGKRPILLPSMGKVMIDLAAIRSRRSKRSLRNMLQASTSRTVRELPPCSRRAGSTSIRPVRVPTSRNSTKARSRLGSTTRRSRSTRHGRWGRTWRLP
ncbi:hypothetical protein JOE51_005390 [Bradyrhizobium japonicum]|nr:hypothetical protein [Bradyrhizobium japonicum]